MTDTRQLQQWDKEFLWHPFEPMQAYREETTPVIDSAEGFELIDTEGNRYLDGVSSLWCNVHGHRVPEIDEAVRHQLEKVSHSTLLGLANTPSVEFAQKLAERTPGNLNKVFYSDSGATSVEVALKIAYQYHVQKPQGAGRRDLFVRLGSAYHGDTIGSVSVGGIDLFHRVYESLIFETLEVPSPVTYRVPPGYEADSYLRYCHEELERVIRANADRIAGFVIEPLVQGAAGIQVHPEGYLRRVRELTAEHGIPLIADEVAVGFGKTGTLFACDQEAVVPDILCLAKGISGGYLPLAATVVSEEIEQAFLGDPAEGKTFYHGHTYTGNPLGCAAAIASLELFETNRVLENVRQNAENLGRRLSEIVDWPHVGDVRRRGIMVGIELVEDKATQQSYPAAKRMGHQVVLAARRRGLALRPLGDVIILMPAPAMPGEQIDQLCDLTFEAIEEATRQS